MTTQAPDRLTEILAQHAAQRPDATALVAGTQRLDWQTLDRRAAALAAGLAARDVGPGTVIGLICPNRAEWVLVLLAAARLGARVAAFNTWAGPWDLEKMLAGAGCEVLIAVGRMRGADIPAVLGQVLPEVFEAGSPDWRTAAAPRLRLLALIDAGKVPAGCTAFEDLFADTPLPAPAAAETALMTLYTSGSTAAPKPVPIHEVPAVDHAREVAARTGLAAEDRVWVPVPLFWSYGGVNALVTCLATGATLVLQETFDAAEAVTLIDTEACTAAYTLPNITGALLAQPGVGADRFPRLRKGMSIGSERDMRRAAEDLGIAGICNAYGSTELYAGACVTPHDWPLERRVTTQGPPLPGNRLTIRDPETGAPLPVGEVGEICVTGYVTPGYEGLPDKTRAAFHPDGAFRTGDLGALDADGVLHFAARADDMIRSGGINVAPAEVEEFLRLQPGVAAAVVVGIPDPDRGAAVSAWVQLAPGAELEAEALRQCCRSAIAGYKVPRRIHVTDEAPPATDTGKVSRQKVRARLEALFGGGGND